MKKLARVCGQHEVQRMAAHRIINQRFRGKLRFFCGNRLRFERLAIQLFRLRNYAYAVRQHVFKMTVARRVRRARRGLSGST